MTVWLTYHSIKRRAESLLKDGPLKHEATPRRIRVLQKSAYIFDTTSAILVWEHPHYPHYYLPEKSLQYAKESLIDGGDGYLITQIYSPEVEAEKLPNAIHFQQGPLAGYIRLNFRGFTWFEEDDQIFVHPTDPYKRIDVRRSTRSVKIELDGVVLAESSFAEHLYETSLPVRYYLPWTSIDWQYLRPSETTTQCPYKGTANYFDVVINDKVYKDLVWYYKTALPECIQVANTVSYHTLKETAPDNSLGLLL